MSYSIMDRASGASRSSFLQRFMFPFASICRIQYSTNKLSNSSEIVLIGCLVQVVGTLLLSSSLPLSGAVI
jgi:hypothetical protein